MTVEARIERPAPHLSGVCGILQRLRTESVHVSARSNVGVVNPFDEKDYQSSISVWEELLRLSSNHPQVGFHEVDIVMFKKALNKKDTK